MTMSLAIIIPVLNEVAVLPKLLEQLVPFRTRGVEIVVVDGGSQDASADVARELNVPALCAAQGRARQMNAGAAAARGEALLFLHADTELPPFADNAIAAALASGRHVWGRFDVRITGRSPILSLIAVLMNLRSRLTGIATGDQGLFMTREAFEAVGGFPDQPLMEDIEICRRLLRLSPPKCLRERVLTSGRRWEARGIWRTIFLMWRLRWAYWRGRPARELARQYR
jgi:rSAM/selenodomain-associated transferase 2